MANWKLEHRKCVDSTCKEIGFLSFESFLENFGIRRNTFILQKGDGIFFNPVKYSYQNKYLARRESQHVSFIISRCHVFKFAFLKVCC